MRKTNIFLLIITVFLLCFDHNIYAMILNDRTHPSQPSAQGATSQYAPGEIIVKFKAEVMPAAKIAGVKSMDVNVTYADKMEPLFKIVPAKTTGLKAAATKAPAPDISGIYKVKLRGGKTVEEAVAAYSKDPNVAYAEPNYRYKIQMVPNDPYYHSRGSWEQPYEDLWGIKKIKCPPAWDITQGEGVVAAVIDTGVDYNHVDLAENIWINSAEDINHNGKFDNWPCTETRNGITGDLDGIDNDGNGYVDDVIGWDFVGTDYEHPKEDNDPMDIMGHGTHVSGTIAAVGNNNKGVIGVAPKAKIMAVRGLDDEGSGNNDDLAKCVIYAADNGAKVLNNSWGGGGSKLLTDAFHYAHDMGCVALAAAGNEQMDVANSAPANIDTVIAVAASRPDDGRCDFSNYGEKIEVAAPGGGYDYIIGPFYGDYGGPYNILSTMSDGSGIAKGAAYRKVANDYHRLAGTSMACPHAAGVTALIVSKHPELSADQVREVLRSSCDDIDTSGKDIYTGYGRVNAVKAVAGGNIEISCPLKYFHSDDIYSSRVVGSTYIGDVFARYELSYVSKYNPHTTGLIATSYTQVEDKNGILGTWDTANLPDGEYTLILKVIRNDGLELTTSSPAIVDNVNEPLVFGDLGDKISFLGKRLIFSVKATDPDDPARPSGKLTYSAANLPTGAEFFKYNGTYYFQWQRPENDTRAYIVTFTVSDGEYAVNREVKLIPMERQYAKNSTIEIPYVSMWDNKVVTAYKAYYNWPVDIELYDISTGLDFKVTDDAAAQTEPVVYNDKVVWTDDRNGNRDIYMYDLARQEEIRITSDPADQSAPAIYKDKIVWTDNRNGNKDIYMYDLSNRRETYITYDGRDQSEPAIYEDKIVWTDNRNGNKDIYMYDLTRQQEVAITTNIEDQCEPAIYGDKIVWTDNRNGNKDIYMYDLTRGEETPIVYNKADQYEPSIYNNRIVWTDTRNDGWLHIYMYDLSAHKETQVTNGYYTAFVADHAPAIYGNKIAWLYLSYDPNLRPYPLNSWVMIAVPLPPPPEIISVEPLQPRNGTIVTIKGKNFGQKPLPWSASKVIFFDGAEASIIYSWANSKIVCQVPENAQSGPLKIITPTGESSPFMLEVIGNKPPVFDPITDKTVKEGECLNFTVHATDPDVNSILTYSAEYLPPGATFTPETRTFSWKPSYYDADLQPRWGWRVKFIVSDALYTAYTYAIIKVINVNGPPEIYPVDDKTIERGKLLSFYVSAQDPDGDKVTFSLSKKPTGAQIKPAGHHAALFTWQPSAAQAGVFDVTFVAKDTKNHQTSKTIKITVPNTPPALDPIGNKTVNAGKVLSFKITATDGDSIDVPKLTYYADKLPCGASLSKTTGAFTWKPAKKGIYTVRFSVKDPPGAIDDEQITITVN